jgi:hypothetical protein
MAKDETYSLSVRLPKYLKDVIERDANENERSLNSQIVMVLKKHYNNEIKNLTKPNIE